MGKYHTYKKYQLRPIVTFLYQNKLILSIFACKKETKTSIYIIQIQLFYDNEYEIGCENF